MPKHLAHNTRRVELTEGGDGGSSSTATRSDSRSGSTRAQHISSQSTRPGGTSLMLQSNQLEIKTEISNSSSSSQRSQPVKIAQSLPDSKSKEMGRGVLAKPPIMVNSVIYPLRPKVYHNYADLVSHEPDYFAKRFKKMEELKSRRNQLVPPAEREPQIRQLCCIPNNDWNSPFSTLLVPHDHQNLIPEMETLSSYNHVRFEKLESYEMVKVLLRVKHVCNSEKYFSSAILSKHPNFNSFSLSELPRNKSAEYKVMLRFCKVPPSLQQPGNLPIEKPDTLPKSFSLKINDKEYSVKIKYINSPYDVTERVMMAHSNNVSLLVKLDASEPFANYYYFGLFLMKRVDHKQLINTLKAMKPADKELTFEIIRKKLVQDSDVLVSEQENEIIVPLRCPLSSRRLDTPVRSIRCDHVMCFDATAFIQMNAISSRWRCPHCQNLVKYQDLIVDGVVSEMLAQAPLDCTRGRIRKDCTWVLEKVANGDTIKRLTRRGQSGTNVEVIDITEEPESSINQAPRNSRSSNTREIECIEISGSSDENGHESDPAIDDSDHDHHEITLPLVHPSRLTYPQVLRKKPDADWNNIPIKYCGPFLKTDHSDIDTDIDTDTDTDDE